MRGPARRVPELRDQVSSRCFQLSLHDARHRRDPLCARDFADEAIRELRAMLDNGWGAKIVHMSKPREWSAHQPFVRMSFTMRPEDVRARIADAVKS